jgi:HEAT repeat protein
MDMAAFYRQHLLAAEGLTLYPAISGLGETGATADDLLIVPFASYPTSRIRRAAIRALAKLNRGAHLDLFMAALTDQVPYVSRQALNALADKASTVKGAQVWELFQSSTHAHMKRNALSLIEKLSKWESIYYLVKAVRDSDEAIAGRSRFGIQRWLAKFNRSFSSPTPEQLARLGSALEEGGNLLDEATLEQLRFVMKGFN